MTQSSRPWWCWLCRKNVFLLHFTFLAFTVFFLCVCWYEKKIHRSVINGQLMINTQSYELNMPYFMLDLSWLTCWHHRETIHSSILHSNHGWLTCWHPRVTIHCSILHTIQGWIWWLKSLIKASQLSFKITRTPLLVRLLTSLGKIVTSDTALKQWCWKTT